MKTIILVTLGLSLLVSVLGTFAPFDPAGCEQPPIPQPQPPQPQPQPLPPQSQPQPEQPPCGDNFQGSGTNQASQNSAEGDQNINVENNPSAPVQNIY